MNVRWRKDVPELCLQLLFWIGVATILFGRMLIHVVLPSAQLDRVLTSQEFQDGSKVASTLAILKQADGNIAFMDRLGIAIAVLSGVGIWKLRDERRSAD